MDALLRRRMMMVPSGTGPVIQRNYLVYGSPTISGNIYTPDTVGDGFIYMNVPFNPGAATSWTIQTKVKIKSASAWKDVIASVNSSGAKVQSIVAQTTSTDSNRSVKLYMSNNGSSWNVASAVCAKSLTVGTWYVFQIVCTYSNGSYVFKMGFPDTGSWSSNKSVSTPPSYGNYISFGGGWGHVTDAEYDLSETKIWVAGEVVWQAITTIQ